MNKKMKFKKRLFAVFSVVLLLASLALGCVASAWSYTDAPFYNYFDNTKIALKDTLSNNAYVSAVNPEFGSITISMKYNGRKGLWVASYSNSDVTLRDLCPEMVVGDTYVLGGNYGTVNLPVKLYNRIVLHDGTNPTVWEFGKSLVITAELLNCRVTYYLGEIAQDDTYFQNGQVYSVDLQLWINKGTVLEDFAPHDLTRASYEDGYNAGVEAGKEIAIKNYEYVTSDNITFAQYGYNQSGTLEFLRFLPETDIVITGNSLEMSALPSSYFEVPDGYTFGGLGIVINLADFDIVWNDFVARFGGRAVSIKMDMVFYVDGLPEYYYSAQYAPSLDEFYRQYRAKDFLTLPDNATIGTVAFVILPDISVNYNFTVGIGASNDLSYELGYVSGENAGLQVGYENGYEKGEQSAQNDAYQNGYDYGYSRGKNDGYYQGVADEANQGGFFKMIYAVIDAPVQVIMKTLNFNILGFNMLSGFISVVSLALCVVVVVYVLKLVK